MSDRLDKALEFADDDVLDLLEPDFVRALVEVAHAARGFTDWFASEFDWIRDAVPAATYDRLRVALSRVYEA